MSYIIKLIILFASLIFINACNENNPTENEAAAGYTYSIPETTNDGWITASLEEVGMSPVPLIEMINMLDRTENHQIHNILQSW